MKHIIQIISLLFLPLYIIAQSSTQNYILTKTYQDANASSSIDVIQYYDGLGRPIETVQKAITTTGKDLVNLTEYDAMGREYRHWLPITSTGNGAYVAPATITANTTNLYESDGKPYTTTDYEPSPLNRVTGQYGAGAAWYAGKRNDSILYQSNTTTNEVAYFYVNSSNKLVRNGYYAVNSLFKTLALDEDRKTTTEYKDKQGKVIMKRSSSDVDTYYVYNDLGQLAYVLPAGFINGMGSTITFDNSNTLLKQFGYLYRYDERGNNVIKRLPGCDSICMVYDKADRLILSQDGNQRAKTTKQWTVTKYDVLGRVLYTGLINSNNSRTTMENTYSGNVTNESYTGSGPVAGYTSSNPTPGTVLTVNYYDSYGFLSYSGNNPGSMLTSTTSGYDNPAATSYAKTLLTGIRVYHLDDPSKYEVTANYYDKYGRMVQTRSSNHLGGYDITYNALDFTGKPTKTYKTHGINGTTPSMTELYTYGYNKAQQPTTTTYSLNGGNTVTLVANSYDELGRLTTKKRHTNADTETYAYNVRNWVKCINSGGFTENLYYNVNPLNSNVCYNGNISYSTWTYNGTTKGYSYDYDNLNRLNSAAFKQGTSSQANGSFDESYTYDKMGNILTLQRKKDNVLLDDLTLHYTNGENSNQLEWVYNSKLTLGLSSVKQYQNKSTATSGEFAYDANGNMTKDLDRNIGAIQYNILNLPDIIQFKNGNQIKNTYDAGGHKLGTEYFTQQTLITPLADDQIISQTYNPGTVNEDGTAYIGNFEYNTLHGNTSLTTLSRIYNDEGYVETPASPQYYYYRKDHLGDNREVWLANTNTTKQWTQYYPSGLPWATSTSDNPGLQERKYNGKEFIEMHGYDTYDYGARGYYPAIGRFTTMDPLAELTPNISPYAYCKGNPVRNIDPSGMWTETDTGYTTSDPDEINEFYNQQKSKDNNNKQEVPSPLEELKKDFLNYFGWGLNPEDPKDRTKIDEGSKNRIKAAEQINEVNKFLIVNGTLFFVGEGAAYCIEEFGGAILVRIVGKTAIEGAEAWGKSLIAFERSEGSIATATKIGTSKASINVNGSASQFFKALNPEWDGKLFQVTSDFGRADVDLINGGRATLQSTSSSTGLPSVKVLKDGYELIFRFTHF